MNFFFFYQKQKRCDKIYIVKLLIDKTDKTHEKS